MSFLNNNLNPKVINNIIKINPNKFANPKILFISVFITASSSIME